MGRAAIDKRQGLLPFAEFTVRAADPAPTAPVELDAPPKGKIGSVAEVAAAWGLSGRLARATRIGRAYEECLACSVEISPRAKVQAGVAYTRERRIVLNARLFEPGREADRDATLLHECAHIISNRRYRARCNHDERWRRVMDMLGEPAQASHRLDYLSREAHAVVAWVCRNCGEAYHFVRPPRRRVTDCYCRHCGPRQGRLDAVSHTA